MAQYPTRLKYNELQFLREPDFTDEQSYHRMMRFQHNLQLHTRGISSGFTVTKSADKKVVVSEGIAINGNGREIVLFAGEEVDLAPFNKANITSYLLISYGEQETDGPIPDPNPEIRNRTEEKPDFSLVDLKPTASDIDVWLAEVDFDNNGFIADIRDKTKLREIPDSGAKITKGSISVDKLSDDLLLAFRTILRPEINNLNPVAASVGNSVKIMGKNFFTPIQVIYENQTDFTRTPDLTAIPEPTKPLEEINSTVPNVPVGAYFIYVVTAFTDATGVSSDPIAFGVTP